MIDTQSWAKELLSLGYGFATGVPCSSLSALQNELLASTEFEYLAATNEGQAIAVAAGASAAHNPSVVLMQNSGLGNAVNPISSLTHIFGVPLLLIVSWRGQPGRKDEPQHTLMGKVTAELLALLNISSVVISSDHNEAVAQLHKAHKEISRSGNSFAIIVPDGSFDGRPSITETIGIERQSPEIIDLSNNTLLPRSAALQVISEYVQSKDLICVSTTGKTSRELFTLADSDKNIYMVGSMGLASSFALGLAKNTQRDTLVVDGDGALMMHMGAMTTIGRYAPLSFNHVILDNGCYDSTGGQSTNSEGVSFARIAAACGYRSCFQVSCKEGLLMALSDKDRAGPRVIHMRIRAGSMDNLGRPNMSPKQVLERFQIGLANTKKVGKRYV